MSETKQTALIVGGHGGIGHATGQALKRHGWRVRALVRTPRQAHADGIEWLAGDAMRAGDVLHAARDAALIVHAVNPPGYRRWDALVLPMLEHSIAAAQASGARLVLPGTIYNYAADALGLLGEHSPQHPPTHKGSIRVAMERRLAEAAAAGLRVLILRCGDFFGPHAGNNWFAQGLFQAGKPVRRIRYPGPRALEHAWAYLPDVGETLAQLLARGDRLAGFESFHFAGHTLSGEALLATIRTVTGNPRIAASSFPWWLATLAAPFNETMRELAKMHYLWQVPSHLDNRKLQAFLGTEPQTPLNTAVRDTLSTFGCLRPEPA